MARGEHMGASWRTTDDTEGRRLWRLGVEAVTIAADLGRTRNAVISRANRKGWGAHPTRSWGR